MLHHIPLRQKIITMLAVMSGLFLVALDQTIVSTALGKIVEEFNSFSSLPWVITAYLLGNTVTVPIAGKLSDQYGRRLMLMVGVSIFTIASFFAASSQDINQLIAARAIQGVGGGVIISNAFTIVGDLFSPRERGRWQGLISAVFAIASIVGPLLGGFLTDAHSLFGLTTSWRWNFWLNVPIGLIAFTVIAKYCPQIKHEKRPKIDYAGGAVLTLALSSLILAVNNTDKIFAPIIENGLSLAAVKTILFSLAGAGLLLFAWIETKAEEPIIPLSFFKNRTFSIIMAIALLFGAAFLSVIIYLTQYNLQVFEVTATTAGLMLVPMVGGLTITAALTGQLITKTGRYKVFFVSGLAIATLGVFSLTSLNPSSPYWQEALIMTFVGIGLGTGMPIMNLAVQNEFSQKQLGVATASNQLFRGLGSTLGVAALGAMLTAGAATHLGNVTESAYVQTVKSLPGASSHLLTDSSTDTILNLNTKDAKTKVKNYVITGSEQSGASASEQQAIAKNIEQQQSEFSDKVTSAFSKSLRPLFYVSSTLMAVATIVSFGLPEKPLRGHEGDAPGVV